MGEGSASGPGTQAEIRTFLIADVRGYTLFTQERGDEAAAKLAAKFAGIAREVVEEHGGSVIELRGDEALAVFASARGAILAATHAQDRFLEETVADPTLPLPVGIGLDAGEAVPLEGGYRGGALNLAARLCGQAAPGEILASQGVVHLARKVDGVRTQDRGELHLKNLTEPVHVYRLSSEAGDPALRFREFAPPSPVRRPALIRLVREHRALSILVALALIAGIAIPAGLLLRSGGSAASIEGDAVASIDPASGRVTGSVGLQSRPGDIAADDSSVWVALPDAGSVDQIDLGTMTVHDTIPVGADPTGIAIGGGSIWVANGGSGTVTRIDQATNKVVDTITVAGGPAGVVFGFGAVWVADSYSATLSKIDPSRGAVKDTIPVGDHPVDVAIDYRSVWVANAGSGTVSQVDPMRDSEVQQFTAGNGPQAVAAGGGAVWVANALDGTVSRIDATTGTVTRSVDVGAAPTGLALTGGSAWVSQGSRGSVAELGPGSGSPAVTPLGSQAAAITAVGDRTIWASVQGSIASHRGGTLTVEMVKAAFDTLDPAFAYSPLSWPLLSLTNDGLVGFRRTSGLAGASLFPDLATSLPRPTAGGKTYTFTLRAGITYSTGEPVRPDDFRRAIERVLAHKDRSGVSAGVQYFSNIVGADRCHAGHPCDLSKGIETDDSSGTVTFHLTSPAPDFLYELALPFAFAVPADTPDVRGKRSFVPATGPYQIHAYTPGKEIALTRNPRFVAWSGDRPDGLPDEIDWQLGPDQASLTKEILQGNGDIDWAPPAAGDFSQLAQDHAGQFYVNPAPATFYMSMDVDSPPFDQVEVRRALNFAIDRRKTQKIFGPGSTLTCQILPPNFPGYEAHCPYTQDPGTTWTGPDMKTAQELVNRSGTRGMHVTIWSAPSWYPAMADYMGGVLDQLGYRTTVKHVSDKQYGAAMFGHPRVAQIGMSGWTTDYPAESGFLGAIARCGVPSNESGFCDPSIDRRMDAATQLQIAQPAVAHQRWASIERDVIDQSPWIPLVNRSFANLVSDRLGNFQVSPQWGPLVDQMWVK